MKHRSQNTADALRERAETLLAQTPDSPRKKDLQSIQELAHELAVYQVELELQNEELRDTHTALQQARDRFATLFNHAPVGYIVLDYSGIIRQTNATWCAMTGNPDKDYLGVAFADMLVEQDAPGFLSRYRTFFRNPINKHLTARLKRFNAPPILVRIEAQPRTLTAANSTVDNTQTDLMVIVSDITDLQDAQEKIEHRNTELDAVNQRLSHIYRVLLGIRSVNQMIVAEDNPDRLIEKTCMKLTEAMGYFNTWIALLGGETGHSLGLSGTGPVAAIAAAGFDGVFATMRKQLEQGDYPPCMERALKVNTVIVTDSPNGDCPNYPLPKNYSGRSGLTRRLAVEGVIYGVLTASVPVAYAYDGEEQDLFDELASDLSFALHKIGLAQRLERKRRHLDLVIEGSGLGTWEWNIQNRRVEFNEQWAAMLGYGIEELAPYHSAAWEKLIHPSDLKHARTALNDCLDGRISLYSCEFRMKHKGGHWVWILSRGRVMTRNEKDSPLHMFGTHTDISEIKKAGARLSLLGKMLDAAPAAILIHETNGQIVFANNAAASLHGYDTAEELMALNLEALDTPESKALQVERFKEIAEHGEARFEVEHLRKDGSTFQLDVLAKQIEWNELPAVLSIATDITERIKAERQLRQSEQRVQSIVRSAPIGIGVVVNRVISEVNPWLCKITGYEAGDLIGQSVRMLYTSNDDFEYVYGEKDRQIRSRGTGTVETRWKRQDGTIIDILLSSTPIEARDLSKGVTFTALDISERNQAETEREKLQSQLTQAQKMESVGRLAGGVAHDFNNMLSVILGNAELAIGDLSEDSLLRSRLDEILNAAERSAKLTSQLLAFARKQTVVPETLDLNETITSMLKMLLRLIGEDIDLLWQPSPRLALVHIDPGQVDQILANLIINARDAIGSRHGKIIIETSHIQFDKDYCANHPGFITGDFVMLAVSDDGCGMDEDTRKHIFEPFFTTKATGEGTGLGLATVYGIAKQNNGFANFYSEPEQGSTFRIYLPAIGEKTLQESDDNNGNETQLGGGETILIVEDETAILRMARMMLNRLGYSVLTASTPNDAIRITEEYDGRIDLLITDVVMPKMNGRDLSETLQKINPRLKILFMSGYTANVIEHQGVLEKGMNFIQKPFTNRQLAQKVRAAITM